MSRILIRSGRILDPAEGRDQTGDVLLDDGRIAEIGSGLEDRGAEISDDAWVMGVVFNGVAKAYSLNLLNHHEVVNDDFGGHPLAAVW